MPDEDPSGAFQRALIARLRGAEQLVDHVGRRVFDEPPGDVTFPYVRLGNLDLTPLKMDGHRDWEVMFSIEVHDRPTTSGRTTAALVGSIIMLMLDEREDEMPVEGYTLDWCQFLTSVTDRTGGGKYYTSIVAFEASISPVA